MIYWGGNGTTKESYFNLKRNFLIPQKFHTCYYAQLWRLGTGTNKTNNISVLDLPALKNPENKTNIHIIMIRHKDKCNETQQHVL